MIKKLYLVIILFFCSLSISATELASGDFSFTLPGDWKIEKEQSGALRATQQTENGFRAFIMSVHYPRSIQEGGDMLIYLEKYLEDLGNQNELLVKNGESTDYKSKSGAPFKYITYSDTARKGFFIGASMGSNAGVMLVTYEGSGEINQATKEFKTILDNLKIKGTVFEPIVGKNAPQVTEDPQKFRDSVLTIAKKLYPQNTYSAPADDPDVIVVKEVHVGLQNLRARFQLSSRTQEDLEELVKEFFAVVLRDPGAVEAVPDYEVAKTRIRVQLMPYEYGRQAPLVSFPFSDDLLIGLVLDNEHGYLYLRTEDAERWGQEPHDLRKVATENLDAASKNIAAHFVNNEEARFIALDTKDGFDAVRILIPGFRKFVGEQLDKPFNFAVPNRDFLICWSSNSSDQFQRFVRDKVRKDFTEQPYPLSPHIYRVTSTNEIVKVEQGVPVNAPKAARH